MNTKNVTALLRVLRVVVMATLVLAGTVSAETGVEPNRISIQSQDTNIGQVKVDSVLAAEDGWLVIYKNADGQLRSIVGYTPVHKGLNTGFTVDVNTVRIGEAPTLWAMLHVDYGAPGIFEWGLNNLACNDAPVEQKGQRVMAAFGTTATLPTSAAVPPAQPIPATQPSAYQITIQAQDTNKNQIVIDSVNAPETGWLVIYKNPNFDPSSILGYTPVRQGLNTNFIADIQSHKVGDAHTLFVRLHTDRDVVGVFEWGMSDLPYNDVPMLAGGQPVTAAFGTVAK